MLGTMQWGGVGWVTVRLPGKKHYGGVKVNTVSITRVWVGGYQIYTVPTLQLNGC